MRGDGVEVRIEVPPAVLDKFEQLLRHKGEIRLIPKTGASALLTEAASTRTKLLPFFEGSKGLVDVRVQSEGAREAKFVRLTRKGIEHLFRARRLEQLRKLLSEAAPEYATECREVALAILAEHHRETNKERAELAKRQNLINEVILEVVRALHEESSRERAAQDVRHRAVEELSKFLLPDAPTGDGKKLPTPPPEGEAGRDFQSAMAEELVFAFKDAAVEETVFQLERVMDNLPGMERVGEPDEEVEFNGTFHETSDPLKPGDRAVVIRSGWRLTTSNGTKLLTRARVRKA